MTYVVAYVALMAGLVGLVSLETGVYLAIVALILGVLWPRQPKPMARRVRR